MQTLEDIMALPKTVLTAGDVAEYLNSDANTIRWQAHHEPRKLGFPVICIKNRVKIPKDGFVDYCMHRRSV